LDAYVFISHNYTVEISEQDAEGQI